MYLLCFCCMFNASFFKENLLALQEVLNQYRDKYFNIYLDMFPTTLLLEGGGKKRTKIYNTKNLIRNKNQIKTNTLPLMGLREKWQDAWQLYCCFSSSCQTLLITVLFPAEPRNTPDVFSMCHSREWQPVNHI